MLGETAGVAARADSSGDDCGWRDATVTASGAEVRDVAADGSVLPPVASAAWLDRPEPDLVGRGMAGPGAWWPTDGGWGWTPLALTAQDRGGLGWLGPGVRV
jgi:hypothetical protein